MLVLFFSGRILTCSDADHTEPLTNDLLEKMLLLLCVFLRVSVCLAECVEGCECVEDPHTVRCVSGALSQVPDTLPEHTRTLLIRGNQIQQIHQNSFSRAENITMLELTNNG